MEISKEQLWYITTVRPEKVTTEEAREGFDRQFMSQDDRSYWRTAAKEVNEITNTMSFDDIWGKIDLPSGLEIMKFIRDGKKISAIKLVREQTGLGLKGAKKLIDSQWFLNIVSDLRMTRREIL